MRRQRWQVGAGQHAAEHPVTEAVGRIEPIQQVEHRPTLVRVAETQTEIGVALQGKQVKARRHRMGPQFGHPFGGPLGFGADLSPVGRQAERTGGEGDRVHRHLPRLGQTARVEVEAVMGDQRCGMGRRQTPGGEQELQRAFVADAGASRLTDQGFDSRIEPGAENRVLEIGQTLRHPVRRRHAALLNCAGWR